MKNKEEIILTLLTIITIGVMVSYSVDVLLMERSPTKVSSPEWKK